MSNRVFAIYLSIAMYSQHDLLLVIHAGWTLECPQMWEMSPFWPNLSVLPNSPLAANIIQVKTSNFRPNRIWWNLATRMLCFLAWSFAFLWSFLALNDETDQRSTLRRILCYNLRLLWDRRNKKGPSPSFELLRFLFERARFPGQVQMVFVSNNVFSKTAR